MANIINKIAVQKMDPAKRQTALDKYNRPENCDFLGVTRVNPEVWDTLSKHTRSQDVKFQRIQTSIIKGLIPLVQLADQLAKPTTGSTCADAQASQGQGGPGSSVAPDVNKAEMLKQLIDGIALIADGNVELNLRRREFMLDDGSVNPEYKTLCSSHVPFSKQLFGDDLTQRVKDITETRKLGRNISKGQRGSQSQFRFRPYPQRGSTSFRGRGFGSPGRFLGQPQRSWRGQPRGYTRSPKHANMGKHNHRK